MVFWHLWFRKGRVVHIIIEVSSFVKIPEPTNFNGHSSLGTSPNPPQTYGMAKENPGLEPRRTAFDNSHSQVKGSSTTVLILTCLSNTTSALILIFLSNVYLATFSTHNVLSTGRSETETSY